MEPKFSWGRPSLSIQAGDAEHAFNQLRELWERIGWSEHRVRTNFIWEDCLRSSHYVLSAWDGQRLVGFGRIVADGIFATFYDIAVDPDYQRQGIGRQLMDMLIGQVKDKGYAGIYLFRWEENPGNQAFYESLGFEPTESGMELRKYMKPE